MRRSFVLIPLSICVLFGFGCKKDAASQNPTTTPREAQVYLPPEAPAESEQDRNLRELREAIQNFENAKTFRAKMSLTSSDGNVSGQIDVMLPDRFHGTMQSPGANGKTETSELIGVGDMLYVKAQNSLWAYVKDPVKAKAYAKAFRSSIGNQFSHFFDGQQAALEVKKTHDGSLGCDRYSTTVASATSTSDKAEIQICVSNALPKRITIKAQDGSANIDYFDYNKLFVIERPIGNYK